MLGGQGRFMQGCSRFANTVQGKCPEAVFWPGDISAYRFPAGLALLLPPGQPQITESQERLSWEALSGIIQSNLCPAQTP